MKPAFRLVFIFLPALIFPTLFVHSQCTTLGQNPSTAFPVCGTTTFSQTTVPLCNSTSLYVPGCQDGAAYANKNPFWYKFTCYTSGTLGFVITPNNLADDYDWQLYDITGLNPDEVYTNRNIIVTGNWSGSSGTTGASANGVNFIQCASNPADNKNTFSQMPQLIAGHEYLLLVSHFTDSQSGYSLSFGGGTAVITDPKIPQLVRAIPDCDGQTLTIILNKKMRCNSLTATGSEFSLSPANATVTAARGSGCSNGFDFDTLTVTLSNRLPPGNYQLIINNGTDGNSLLDNCNNNLTPGDQVPFAYNPPLPIYADSVGRPGCAPDHILVYFPKRIDCSTIAADGSDFAITGPSPVTISGASGLNCTDNKSSVIQVRFATPIVNKGNYILTLKTGNDGGTITDECGLQSPTHARPFRAEDTVSAKFNYSTQLDCRFNTLLFSHYGAHDVNSWNWIFDNGNPITTQTYTIKFAAASTHTVQLAVSNGVCSDTVLETITMNNEVIAGFDMPDVICPEDPLVVHNTSKGLIDNYRWSFGSFSSSNLKDPAPVQFPRNNIESTYPVKLVVVNNMLGCTDSLVKKLKVLNNCFIAVPSAFTPNNDGLNDYLYPNNAIKATNLEFRVYNRWGQEVFHSSNWTQKWDGKVGGIPQATGVYVWFLKYTHADTGQKVFQKGTTTLIR